MKPLKMSDFNSPHRAESERHEHVYERLSVCCGAVRQDRSLALYDADAMPICDECGTLASFESRCWCGEEEE